MPWDHAGSLQGAVLIVDLGAIIESICMRRRFDTPYIIFMIYSLILAARVAPLQLFMNVRGWTRPWLEERCLVVRTCRGSADEGCSSA